MVHILGAENLHLAYPNRQVLSGVTVGLHEGDRIGVVGRNGDGKSSLLRILARQSEPDSGRVTARSGTRVGVLDQADTLTGSVTVRDAVVGDVAEHQWASDGRVRDVIDGLLGDVDWVTPVSDLSGGQRRRVELAALLIGDYDVLLLDEPTNHLDVEAINWLAGHLNARWGRGSGALLVVTHDRWFLDEVCGTTWEVHDGIVEPFDGGYAAYILQRVERDRQAAASAARQANLARKELAWLRRGAPARTSKPKFRIEAANALIADEPEVRNKVELASLAVSRLGKDVVDLVDVGVSYGDHVVLRDVEWRIAPGERTGVLGKNGAGKSTLLGLISGDVAPTTGRVKHGKTVKVHTLSQRMDEMADLQDEQVSAVIGRLRATFHVGSGSSARDLTPGQLLERLGFDNSQLSTRVKDLSGGQQRRLHFLLVLLEQPNVLVLDEPTNDLDTDMLAAVEDLLDSWPGTLIVVSHDRYFLERVTDQQYAIIDAQLRHMPGGVDEYVRRQAQSVPAQPRAEPRPEPAGMTGAQIRALEKEASSIERRIEKLTSRIKQEQNLMAERDQSDYVGLAATTQSIAALQDEVQELEQQWFDINSRL